MLGCLFMDERDMANTILERLAPKEFCACPCNLNSMKPSPTCPVHSGAGALIVD